MVQARYAFVVFVGTACVSVPDCCCTLDFPASLAVAVPVQSKAAGCAREKRNQELAHHAGSFYTRSVADVVANESHTFPFDQIMQFELRMVVPDGSKIGRAHV